jgi:hypothetical protein
VIAPRFVDVHSHGVPSGDDGAVSVEEGLELCRAAANAGTRVLFATPHTHEPLDSYPWTPQREQRDEEAFAAMQPTAERMGLDLRRGREVYPTRRCTALSTGFGWAGASESTRKASSRCSPIRRGVPQLPPTPRPPFGSPRVGGRCA